MEDGGFWGSFGTFLFWFFTIFGAVIGLALIGVLVWLYLQIRMYLALVDKVMAVTESGLRFVGIEKKLTKFGLFKMALRFLLSKKARANAIVSARGFVTTRLFTRKKGAGGAAMLEKAKRVASKNEEKLLEMAYNEAVNFAKAETGKVLAGEPLNLAKDAKQAALSGGKELLKAAGGEALDFAQGEIRKAVAGGAPEGREGKAEAIAEEAAVAEAQGEAPAAGGASPALEKICRGMERLLSQEKLDEAKLVSVVEKLLSPDLKLDIPRKQWAKWGKLARERGAYEVAALLLEKAASEL